MFRFLPTAASTEFDATPEVKEAWHDLINSFFELNIVGDPNDDALSALEELRRWGRGQSDLRFYNPALNDVIANSKLENVFWKALPTSFDERFGDDEDQKFAFLDERQEFRTNQGIVITRIQDEYCEWKVQRDNENRITRVLFTSEPPEFYRFLYEDWLNIGTDVTHTLLLSLYKDRCDGAKIDIADLGNGIRYDAFNRWNNEFCVHMQQPNNTLGAQVNIAARSSIARVDTASGVPITDAAELIECARFGNGERQSDPSIGATVNSFARDNHFVTLQNPVGLYMTHLDTRGWATPDGTDAQQFWQILRGVKDEELEQSMIARAEYRVPPEKGYSVSDIKIGGEEIQFGGQIAAKLSIRIGVMKSPITSARDPHPIGCRNERPRLLEPLLPINQPVNRT